MRAVIQRVLSARVLVDGETVGSVGELPGGRFVILLGVHRQDTEAEARLLARKISELRVFTDDAGRMNHSLAELGGESLVVSQFTLFADVRKGRRPSFFDAAPPERAMPLIEVFCTSLSGRVARGQFGAKMLVELANDGPVTVVLDTDLWAAHTRALTD
jgi:D-tyrosyl-tRNA(Tyr) deacylase